MIHFLKETVYDKVEEYLKRADSIFQFPFPRPERVEFDVRGKVAARVKMKSLLGMVRYSLHFNKTLLRDNKHYVEETTAHEVAHVISYCLARHGGHGHPWKEAMLALGVQPERLHSYNIKHAIRGGSEKYVCNCYEPHYLSKLLHNRIKKGQVRHCTRCGEQLIHINQGYQT